MTRALALSAIAFAGACSLFGLDGFSGGDDPGDSGVDAAIATDGPTIPNDADSLVDGGGGDATPSGPFCKTVGLDASLCDDFEEPGTFTGKWPLKDSYLGTIEVLDGIGIAGRGARFSAVPRADGQVGQDGRVILGYASPTPASFVDAELAVKLTSVPSTTYAAGPLYIELKRTDGGRARVGFLLDGNGQISVNPIVFYGDGGVLGSGNKTIATLPIGAWTRIRLVVDLTKMPSSLFAYVDGALKHEATLTGFTPDTLNVLIGAGYVGTTDGGTVGFDMDDARISWK